MGGIHRRGKARVADQVDQFTNITEQDRFDRAATELHREMKETGRCPLSTIADMLERRTRWKKSNES